MRMCLIPAEGELTIIAHVACNNTKDSKVLAAHAESLGRQNDMEFMEKIRDIGGVEDVTLIQYNGEYHG